MHKDAWIAAILAPLYWEFLRWLARSVCKALDEYRQRHAGPAETAGQRVLRVLTHKWWD